MCADFGNTMILLAPKGYRAITDISYNILLGFSLIDTYSTKTKAIQSYSCVMNQPPTTKVLGFPVKNPNGFRYTGLSPQFLRFMCNESTKSTKVSHQTTEEKESSYTRYIYRGPKSYFEEIKELPSKLSISSRHKIEISVYAYI